MTAVLHRDLNQPPRMAVRGRGSYLFDTEDNAFLDGSGGAAVSCLGHGHPRIADAIRRQLQRLEFAHSSFFTNEPVEQLAARLISSAPPGFGPGRVAVVGSGSEAIETAIKLARQHCVEKGEPRRTRFIARRMSYHGNTLGALAMGGHVERKSLYEPMLREATLVSPCYAYRFKEDSESLEQYGQRLVAELSAEIERLGPDTVVAFVAEPIVGATLGSVPPVQGYLSGVRKVCDRYGVLLIADEVMCGMGRCGAMFASSQEDCVPDIIAIAKGLGAGYQPIGAVLVREALLEPIVAGTGELAHGHTYMAHAIACAAALAVLETIEADDLLAAVRHHGTGLEMRLRDRFENHPNIGDIRGRGLLWSLELVRDRKTKAPFAAELRLAQKIKRQALAIGLLCYPSSGTANGRDGAHILLAPPYTVSSGELDELVDKLGRAVEAALSDAQATK